MIAALLAVPSNPIGFLIGFIVVVCVIAVVIIAAKWLISLTGWAIPQPLLVILGILLFLILFLWLLGYAGYYHW